MKKQFLALMAATENLNRIFSQKLLRFRESEKKKTKLRKKKKPQVVTLPAAEVNTVSVFRSKHDISFFIPSSIIRQFFSYFFQGAPIDSARFFMTHFLQATGLKISAKPFFIRRKINGVIGRVS